METLVEEFENIQKIDIMMKNASDCVVCLYFGTSKDADRAVAKLSSKTFKSNLLTYARDFEIGFAPTLESKPVCVLSSFYQSFLNFTEVKKTRRTNMGN